jgi:hypothetical protein
MTKDELNRRIAELKGYVKGYLWKFPTWVKDGQHSAYVPDYCTWPHAGPMLQDLLIRGHDVLRGSDADGCPTAIVKHYADPDLMFAGPIEELPTTIARAWLAMKEAAENP